MDKTRSAGTVEPSKTADDMIGTTETYSFLAGKFTFPVNCFSSGRAVVFVVWAGGVAIKYIISGNGDEPDSVPMACGSHIGCSERIEFVCKINFGFAFIHSGHGGAMDYCIGLDLFQQGIITEEARNHMKIKIDMVYQC